MTHRVRILTALLMVAGVVQAAEPAASTATTTTPTSATAPHNSLQAQLAKLGYAQGEPVQKIQNYRVDGWNYIDDKHIMIYAGASVRYLISTMNNCPDLASAERIGFSSTASSLTKFDKLVVRGPGGMRQSCPIDALYQLNSLKRAQ